MVSSIIGFILTLVLFACSINEARVKQIGLTPNQQFDILLNCGAIAVAVSGLIGFIRDSLTNQACSAVSWPYLGMYFIGVGAVCIFSWGTISRTMFSKEDTN